MKGKIDFEKALADDASGLAFGGLKKKHAGARLMKSGLTTAQMEALSSYVAGFIGFAISAHIDQLDIDNLSIRFNKKKGSDQSLSITGPLTRFYERARHHTEAIPAHT